MLMLVARGRLLYWQAKRDRVVDSSRQRTRPFASPTLSLLGERQSPRGGLAGASGAHRDRRHTRPMGGALGGAARDAARGWESKLDRYRNAIFYDVGPLSAPRYHAGCASSRSRSFARCPTRAVRILGRAEARCCGVPHAEGDRSHRAGPPYLSSVALAHWRLFAVSDRPHRVGARDAHAARHDSFSLRAPVTGTYIVRLHVTPYWKIARGGHGWSAGARRLDARACRNPEGELAW